MKDSTEQAMTDLEYCIARYGRKDSFTLAAYDALEAMKKMRARIAELEKDAAHARKEAIEDCAELLSKQHAWITNVAAATLVLNIDTAMQKD